MASRLVNLPGHDGEKLHHQKFVYTQRRPYHKPLPYIYDRAEERDGYTLKPLDKFGNPPGLFSIAYAKALNSHKTVCGMTTAEPLLMKNFKAGVSNKALAKMDDELTVAQNMFESWYERKEGYALIMNAGKKLLEFVTNFRKPKYWKSIAGDLKQPTSLPEAWITYQFGIKPIMMDIDAVMNGLAHPLPSHPFFGGSRSTYTGTMLSGSNTYYYSLVYTVKYGCRAIPNPNPNVGLANIAGLTTPLSTVFSVIPWGWAVDYIVNASQLLSNLEVKHPGVTCRDYYKTETFETSWTGKRMDNFYSPKDQPLLLLSGQGYSMRRTLVGKPAYQLHLDFPLLGSNKAANLFSAIALTMKGKAK